MLSPLHLLLSDFTVNVAAALLTSEQASNLSTRSVKSTLLAAAGQPNLSLEGWAKAGHGKKSVQLFSRDDVWPSLFLQREVLVDSSSGWRPLTSQACVAKQPFPEARFRCLKMTFNWSKCSNPKLPQPPQLRQKKAATPIPVEDSDERGEEDSSSSSSCDSSDSSDDECATPTTSSVMVMNEKSHVVHIL